MARLDGAIRWAGAIRVDVERNAVDPAAVRAQLDGLLVGDWTAKGPAVFMMNRTHEVSMCATWLSDGERRAFCRVFSWTSPEIFLNVGHEECAVMIFHGD